MNLFQNIELKINELMSQYPELGSTMSPFNKKKNVQAQPITNCIAVNKPLDFPELQLQQ